MCKPTKRLHRRSDEGGAPVRAEPRLILATAIDVGNDLHLVAVDFTFEHSHFIDRKSVAVEVRARAILIEMQDGAQLGIAAAVGLLNFHGPFRVFDLLRRDDAGLAESQLIRPITDALVAQPISLGSPVPEPMPAGRALHRFDALDGALPASAKDRRQHWLWRHQWHADRRRRWGSRRRC